MKSFLLHLIVVFGCFTLNAQNIITVNNTPGTVADYTSVNDAIKAAKDGDYIYVQHSKDSYGDVFIDKRVHIKGRSHSLKGYTTSIEEINFIKGSSGSSLEGCYVRYLNFNIENGNLSNIKITNSKFFNFSSKETPNYTGKNITFKGNVLESSGLVSSLGKKFSDITFSNNIAVHRVLFESSTGLKIYNNIFSNNFSEMSKMLWHNGEDKLIIQNCIYVGYSASSKNEYADNTTYKNCITYNYNPNGKYTFTSQESTDIIGCKENTDPKFVKVRYDKEYASISNGQFNPNEDDVRRQPNAPLPNAGVFGDL